VNAAIEVMRTLDIPAMVLVVMVVVMAWVLYQTQKRPDFDFGNMMRDDTTSAAYPKGKESVYRLIAPGCFTIHTWYIVHETVLKGLEKNDIIEYALLWSGSLVAVKLIDAVWPKP
jgi:hypothetical protein